MFQYVNHDTIAGHMDTVAAGIRSELSIWERADPQAEGLVAHFDEHYPHYFGQVSEFARNFVTERLRDIQQEFQPADASHRDSVLEEVRRLQDQIDDMRYPFEDR